MLLLWSSTFLALVNKLFIFYHDFISYILLFVYISFQAEELSWQYSPTLNIRRNLIFQTPFDTLRCLTIWCGPMSQKGLWRRQIPSLTQNALGLFDQWVWRECPFMLQQWGEAFANCLPIMSFSTKKRSTALWKRGHKQTSEELCLFSRCFSCFPYACIVIVCVDWRYYLLAR